MRLEPGDGILAVECGGVDAREFDHHGRSRTGGCERGESMTDGVRVQPLDMDAGKSRSD